MTSACQIVGAVGQRGGVSTEDADVAPLQASVRQEGSCGAGSCGAGVGQVKDDGRVHGQEVDGAGGRVDEGGGAVGHHPVT